jgi:hypothetical protein
MKNLCLIFDQEKQLDAVPKRELNARIEEHLAYHEVLRENGHFIGTRPSSPSVMTVRVRNGKLSTTDGAFIETKEQLGGFYLIDAKDLNEAIQVAPKISSARTAVSRCSRAWSSSSHRAGD